MSDYLGPNQTRVLDSTNRNFESITYQQKKPPLSSEVNLTGKIDAERNQNTIKATLPSGWLSVGQIRDNVSAEQCQAGDILCAPELSNAFKFIAQNLGNNSEKNIAIVNGWRIVVQGGSSPQDTDSNYTPWSNSTEDCLITLPPPPTSGSRIDFVFLEVWRKLLTPDDNIYQYGNVDHRDPFTNDLIDPARGFETSLRVQIQYRIRVSIIDDFDLYPEGFGPSVYVQGPLPTPNSTCDHANYSQVAGDPGLWIAGAGDSVAQELLETVDGHVYAIPMFAIRRRNTLSYDSRNAPNGNAKTLADYQNGKASDRPDDYFNDWIVGEDIVDLRHRIASTVNMLEICKEAFEKLQANTLKTRMGYQGILGLEGSTLTAVDTIAPTSSYASCNSWSNYIAAPNGVRRFFSNAMESEKVYLSKTVNDKTTGVPGGAWQVADAVTFDLDDYGNFPEGVSLDITRAYAFSIDGYIWDISSTIVSPRVIIVTIDNRNYGFATTADIIFPITLSYTNGLNSLSEVPVKFLESRKIELLGTPMLSTAMKDQDIRVRVGSLANAVVSTDMSAQYNMLRARGGSTKHGWNFGHQMVYHALGAGNSIVSVPRDMSGYVILGVADIQADGVRIENPSITRSSTAFTVDMGVTVDSSHDIALTLYTDNKYFDANKQGRAITDSFKMTTITPTPAVGDGARTTFLLNPGLNTVMAIGSYSSDLGNCYAYVDGSRTVLSTNNNSFPDATTFVSIEFPSAPGFGKAIDVPVLLKTAIDSTEGYAFYYKYVPYQGLLDATPSPTWVTGSIEAEGNAITTTAGSGAIVNNFVNDGSASFNGIQVTGYGTYWTNLIDASSGTIKPGWYIQASGVSDATKLYGISEIASDTLLILDTTADRTSISPESYTVIRLDYPTFNYPNIIDRFPTLSTVNDSSGESADIYLYFTQEAPVLQNLIASRDQDFDGFCCNAPLIGMNSADRGRSTIYVSGNLGRGTLGLKYYPLIGCDLGYHKTYQSYILNKNNSGRLYLMVIGTETEDVVSHCKFEPKSIKDTVDIFELPGRPLIPNRHK